METIDHIYVCLSCGETNTYWTTCQNCEPIEDKIEERTTIQLTDIRDQLW